MYLAAFQTYREPSSIFANRQEIYGSRCIAERQRLYILPLGGYLAVTSPDFDGFVASSGSENISLASPRAVPYDPRMWFFAAQSAETCDEGWRRSIILFIFYMNESIDD